MDELDMLAEMSPVEAGERPAGETAAAASLASAQQRLEAAHQVLARAEEAVQKAAEKSEETLSGWLRAAATETLAQAERTRDRAAADVENIKAEVEAAKASETRQSNDIKKESATQEESPLVYQSTEEFLHEHLLPLYNRIIDSRNGKWCRQWYLHPEAVSRVEALWRAWEHLRLDPATGMSVWWRDHADTHMAVLLSQKGPFHGCDSQKHRTPTPFPCDIAPTGWFPRAGDTPDQ